MDRKINSLFLFSFSKMVNFRERRLLEDAATIAMPLLRMMNDYNNFLSGYDLESHFSGLLEKFVDKGDIKLNIDLSCELMRFISKYVPEKLPDFYRVMCDLVLKKSMDPESEKCLLKTIKQFSLKGYFNLKNLIIERIFRTNFAEEKICAEVYGNKFIMHKIFTFVNEPVSMKSVCRQWKNTCLQIVSDIKIN